MPNRQSKHQKRSKPGDKRLFPMAVLLQVKSSASFCSLLELSINLTFQINLLYGKQTPVSLISVIQSMSMPSEFSKLPLTLAMLIITSRVKMFFRPHQKLFQVVNMLNIPLILIVCGLYSCRNPSNKGLLWIMINWYSLDISLVRIHSSTIALWLLGITEVTRQTLFKAEFRKFTNSIGGVFIVRFLIDMENHILLHIFALFQFCSVGDISCSIKFLDGFLQHTIAARS